NRLRLAGENEPCLQLPRLKRVIDVHLRLALDQLGAAGRAHAALAGKGQIDAGTQGGIEDGFTLGDRHLAPFAVDYQRRERFWRRARRNDRLRARLAAKPRHKALDMDTLLGNADVAASRL